MNIKEVGRYVFNGVILTAIGYVFYFFVNGILGWDFKHWHVAFFVVVALCSLPRSNIVWRRIVKLYGKKVALNGELLSTVGFLTDEQEGKDESILICTSIVNEGLILYRPHLVRALRDSALVKWEDLTISKVLSNEEKNDDEIQDQIEDLSAVIAINGIRPRLTIPWTKELELYSNMIIHAHEHTANKSSNMDAFGASS